MVNTWVPHVHANGKPCCDGLTLRWLLLDQLYSGEDVAV